MSWEKVVVTLREMMTDRELVRWRPSPSQEDVFLAENEEEDEVILVYLCRHEKFNIDGVKYLVYQLQQHKIPHGLVVFQNIITSSAKKAVEDLLDYTIETFEKKELQYNITQHRLYSPHVRVPKDEISKHLPKIDIHCLPVLLRSDPVSRYYHFSRGEVVRVDRRNQSIAYRFVK